MSSLKDKAVSGVKWTALESFGQYLIQFGITILLARILTPSEFGTIEMLLIFTALSKVIVESGFSQALIRKKDVTSKDLNSVFYFNIVLGLIVYLVLFFSAPFIAEFYKSPELILISRVIFLGVIINSFSIIHTTIISTELNFKLLTRSSIFAAIFSAIVGISLAKMNYGVWALVYQTLSFAFSKAVLLWFANNWRPQLIFSLTSIRQLFQFSSKLLFIGVLDVLFTNIQSLLIGRFYGKVDLGFYGQAKKFQSVPSTILTQVVQKVTYPILSKIQDDSLRLKYAYRKIIEMTIFIIFPLMLGLWAISDRLFLIVLTEKWLPAVPYFKVLCIFALFFPLYSINLNIITVNGKGEIYLKVGVFKRVTVVLAIIFTIKFGVLALIWGQVIASLFNSIYAMIQSGKLINYKLFEQVKDILPILIVSTVMASAMYFIGVTFTQYNIMAEIMLQVLAGLIIYFTLGWLFRLSAMKEFIKLTISRFHKKSLV